ncbi:MAG TPA: hypothetical protein VM364_09265 [Vicinamibacterales bacterium]|nr:hypothetical protein [Vicinamibacterales bacterium]
MPNQTIPVTITFNYNNGSPTWTAPNVVPVNHGEIDTIKWSLVTVGVPAGASARFAMSNPIQFKVINQNGVNSATWGGPAPTRVSDTVVQVTDDNTASGPTKHYFYSINVEVVSGSTVTPYSKDPEVENVGG